MKKNTKRKGKKLFTAFILTVVLFLNINNSFEYNSTNINNNFGEDLIGGKH